MEPERLHRRGRRPVLVRLARRRTRQGQRRGGRDTSDRAPLDAARRQGRSDAELSGSERRPSKPWGCRSKTLTPTPEPAGYCAGDVAGERGDRARRSSRRSTGATATRVRERSGPRRRDRADASGLGRSGRIAATTLSSAVLRRLSMSVGETSRARSRRFDRRRRPGRRRDVAFGRTGRAAASPSTRSSSAVVYTLRDGRIVELGRTSETEPRPSKPWASRSRRCRRRTWRSCAPILRSAF